MWPWTKLGPYPNLVCPDGELECLPFPVLSRLTLGRGGVRQADEGRRPRWQRDLEQAAGSVTSQRLRSPELLKPRSFHERENFLLCSTDCSWGLVPNDGLAASSLPAFPTKKVIRTVTPLATLRCPHCSIKSAETPRLGQDVLGHVPRWLCHPCSSGCVPPDFAPLLPALALPVGADQVARLDLHTGYAETP